MSGLAEYLQGWWPEPLRRTDRIRQWPVDAFAGLLDQPALDPGAPLPPLWHWFSFLDHPAQSEIGSDGHPAAGHFLPPIPHRRRMFAGGRWRTEPGVPPIRVGDEVTMVSSVTSIEPKTGRSGEMAFVTVRNEFSRDGVPTVVEEQDIVYRSEPPEGPDAVPAVGASASGPKPGPASAGNSASATPAQHELRIDPDPPLLFRYSALTYNTHRIHYDQSYATGVEGYPGLVVHGPLLALLALELPRRHRPDDEVLEFRYRLRKPAFAGATIVAGSWEPDGDGWCELSVGELDQAPSLTATARLGRGNPSEPGTD
ncbi:MAG TPA: MaoC family dehydratase N-terminal domain-containing protein [Pseudonocardia sp.]|nr:MaoC family dehydratase N-terminal domain-containing protein [Pseudonocardia sp.]